MSWLGAFSGPTILSGVRVVLRFSVRRPVVVLSLTAVAMVLALAFVPRVGLQLDGRSLIPADHPSQAASDGAADRFDARDLILVAVSDPEGIFRPPILERVGQVSAALERIPGIDGTSVASLSTLPRLYVDGDLLSLRPFLDVGSGVSRARAQRLGREVEALGLDDGILVSRDHRTTVVAARAEPWIDREILFATLDSRLQELPGDGTIRLSGNALAQAVLGRVVAADLIVLLPVVVGGLLLLMTLLFRHPVPALASTLEIGVSLVLTAGIMGLAGASVFVTTLVLPVILLVIGVSDDIYALEVLWQHLERQPGESVRELIVQAFSRVAGPILLTTVTTMAGLISLTASQLLPQRTFGLFGAVAILLSTVMSFTLVPAILSLLLGRRSVGVGRGRRRRGRLLAGFVDGLERWGPRRILAGVGLLTVLFGVSTLWIEVEDSWLRNLPPGHSIVEDTRWLDRQTAGSLRLEIAVDSGAPEGLLEPETFEALGRLEEALGRLPAVGAVTGFHTDVRRARAALEGVPFDGGTGAGAAGGEMGRAEIDQTLLLLSSIQHSPLEAQADRELRWARVVVFLSGATYSRIDGILDHLEPWGRSFADLVPFGDAWISYKTVDLVVSGQVRSVALALVTDLLVLLVVFRSARLALLTLAPIVVAVAGAFAFLALAGIPLSIASSMFAAIALGIGVDYAIHLVAHFDHHLGEGLTPEAAIRRSFLETAPAILKSTVALTAGLALLSSLSSIRPNAELGILVCVSQVLCALTTLVVVPAVVLATRSRNPGEIEIVVDP